MQRKIVAFRPSPSQITAHWFGRLTPSCSSSTHQTNTDSSSRPSVALTDSKMCQDGISLKIRDQKGGRPKRSMATSLAYNPQTQRKINDSFCCRYKPKPLASIYHMFNFQTPKAHPSSNGSPSPRPLAAAQLSAAQRRRAKRGRPRRQASAAGQR